MNAARSSGLYDPFRVRKTSCQASVGVAQRSPTAINLSPSGIRKQPTEVSWSLACYHRFSHHRRATYQECLLVSQKILRATLSAV